MLLWASAVATKMHCLRFSSSDGPERDEFDDDIDNDDGAQESLQSNGKINIDNKIE